MTGLRSVALYSALSVAAMFGVGCEKTSAFCDDHPDDVGCGGTMQPDGNTGDGCTEACGGATPVCDKPNDTCVECLASSDCGTATAPVCSDVGSANGKSCHACEGPDDCDSKACLPSGACAAADDVAYAKANGDDTGACSFAAPCQTIAGALGKSSTKTAVVLGSMSEQIAVGGGETATVLGGTADASVSFNADSVFKVSGGVLTLANLHVQLSSGYCVDMTGAAGMVDLSRVELNACSFGGVHASIGSVSIERSSIHQNPGGGVMLDNNSSGFTITNTYILNNGGDTFSGGVVLAGAAGTFAFNTVFGNRTLMGATSAAGVDCKNGEVKNNIVVGNTRAGGSTAVDTGGTCVLTANIAGVAPETLDLDITPATAKLKATSTDAIDKVTPMPAIDTDNKGLIRPQGAMADIGADEFRQNP